MIPRIIDEFTVNEYNFWISSEGYLVTSVITDPIDMQSNDQSKLEYDFYQFLNNLPSKVLIKIHLLNRIQYSENVEHYRANAISARGRIVNQVVYTFQIKVIGLKSDKNFERIASDFVSELQPLTSLRGLGLNVSPLETEEYFGFTHNPKLPIVPRSFGLETGKEYISILKLIKLGTEAVTAYTISELVGNIGNDPEVIFSARKIPQNLLKARLSQISKRESPFSLIGASKIHEAESALKDISLSGSSYVGFELHIILRSSNEDQARLAIMKAKQALSVLGEFNIETYGALPSYISCLPGANQHFSGFDTLMESTDKVLAYAPVFSCGAGEIQSVDPGAIAFHRRDYSRDFYDVFDRRYNNYCSVIVGRGGSGKSVLLNRVIACASNNPNTRIIVVDVKGSHTRLVSNLNGQIHQISLNEASGVNPFNFLISDQTDYTLGVLRTYISELMLDDEEKRISSEELFDLELAIKEFAANLPNNPNLHKFVDSLPKDFPRIKLLKRYTQGLSTKIYLQGPNFQNTESRIRYYNFQNIDLASNLTVTRGMMASILADFNFQLFKKKPEEKFLFICDETPFFINQCFRSFTLLNKNVRALNGSLILTVQVSNDLIVDEDQSLIDNSGAKILMSIDSGEEVFQKRFQLTDYEMGLMRSVKGKKGQYSQFLLKDAISCRTGALFLSDKEYWESTTESYDLAELNAISEMFEGLTTDELCRLASIKKRTHAEVSR